MLKLALPCSKSHYETLEPFYPRLFALKPHPLRAPFESLMVQFYPQLQASLEDHLHEQKFASLLVDVPLDIMQTRFYSWVFAH